VVAGLLLWGAAYVGVAIFISFAGTPTHRIPAYLLFEGVCLLPWFIWLIGLSARKGRGVVIATLVQASAVAAISYIVQVVATNGLFWDYFPEKNRLLGVRISGVPLEEFIFYPLMINLSVLLYLWVCGYLNKRGIPDFSVKPAALRMALLVPALLFLALAVCVFIQRNPSSIAPVSRTWEGLGIPRYAEGSLGYGWTLTCLLSVSANLVIFYLAERRTALQLRAVVLVAGIFMLMCLLVEFLGTGWGWWVYNRQQVSGLWAGGIPLESLPAYLTAVMMPTALFEAARTILGEEGLP